MTSSRTGLCVGTPNVGHAGHPGHARLTRPTRPTSACRSSGRQAPCPRGGPRTPPCSAQTPRAPQIPRTADTPQTRKTPGPRPVRALVLQIYIRSVCLRARCLLEILSRGFAPPSPASSCKLHRAAVPNGRPGLRQHTFLRSNMIASTIGDQDPANEVCA